MKKFAVIDEYDEYSNVIIVKNKNNKTIYKLETIDGEELVKIVDDGDGCSIKSQKQGYYLDIAYLKILIDFIDRKDKDLFYKYKFYKQI